MNQWVFPTIVVVWFLVYLWFRHSKAWLMAYILGAVGFTLLAITVLRGSAFERFVEQLSAVGAHYVCKAIGIPTKVFFDAPGTLLVLIVYQKAGWTAVEVDIECSGLLELTVFTALVVFFAGFSWWYKGIVLPTGIITTFLMNVIRIVIIVVTIFMGGKSAIYIAHTVVGRAIFFLMVVALYWYVFTRWTSSVVRRRLMRS